MTSKADQEKKQKEVFENALESTSVVLNEGAFVLRVNKSSVNQIDFEKQCMYGDAYQSAYSPHIFLIPTSIFLPQMFVGKNVFLENLASNTNVPLLDSFLPYSILLTKGPEDMKTLYDELFDSTAGVKPYSETYPHVMKSVLHHLDKLDRRISFPGEFDMLTNREEKDQETMRYLNECSAENYTVIVFTQACSAHIQKSEIERLKFGKTSDNNNFVPLANGATAKFDGYVASAYNQEQCTIELSEQLTRAIKRELLTQTQMFLGFEKDSRDGEIQDYVRNVSNIFDDDCNKVHHRNVANVESYALACLKLFLSRNFETDENLVRICAQNQQLILNDPDHKQTIRKKILFELLMFLDMGSCFNSRNLERKKTTDDKQQPILVSTDRYRNPFVELHSAVYENISLLTHMVTLCSFYSRVRNRAVCQSCEQKICAIDVPLRMFTFSTNNPSTRKERTGALSGFYTTSQYNRVGALGNLRERTTEESNPDPNQTKVVWEKHHADLLTTLMDTYKLDLKPYVDSSSQTNDDNIDERAERLMDAICSLLDGAIDASEQFCEALHSDHTTVDNIKSVESEIRNVYHVSQMYEKGLSNFVVSESLLYVLRSMVLILIPVMKGKSTNEVYLTVRASLLSNNSGFTVRKNEILENRTMKQIAVRSYTNDVTLKNVNSEIQSIYRLDELYSDIGYKCKTYLFGRHDDNKKDIDGVGGRRPKQKTQHLQNLGSKKSASTQNFSNSFLHFKTFCSKQACEALGIANNDFCREMLNAIRDSKLERFAYLFDHLQQFKVRDWSSVLLLVSVEKMLEYLRIKPSFDRLSFLTFNRLAEDKETGKFQFKQTTINEDFNKHAIIYAQNCNVVQFKSAWKANDTYKKCAGKHLDSSNELLNSFSVDRMHPGPPIFYLRFSELSGKNKTGINFLSYFLNQEQFRLEEDAAYTTYIKSKRREFYDALFEEVFADQASYIENKYSEEILTEMLDEFDYKLPSSEFANDTMREFLRLVLSQYFNSDQSRVTIAAKQIKEVYEKAKARRGVKRQREDEKDDYVFHGNQHENEQNQGEQQKMLVSYDDSDEDDDAEYQLLTKRSKLD